MEIPKNTQNFLNEPIISREISYDQLKTIVLSGGEGYDEFSKSPSMASNQNQSANQLLNSATIASASLPILSSALIQATNDSNSNNNNRDGQNSNSNLNSSNLIGKDDLTNYVLAWDIWNRYKNISFLILKLFF